MPNLCVCLGQMLGEKGVGLVQGLLDLCTGIIYGDLVKGVERGELGSNKDNFAKIGNVKKCCGRARCGMCERKGCKKFAANIKMGFE